MDRKKIVWAVISLILAGLTVYAITSQSKEFSMEMLRQFLHRANPGWLLMAFASMFGFIFFEGMALIRITKRLGYKRKVMQGITYGGADVYFSAVTPSASGGQPASAYFMLKDGIPASAVTASLLINLVMYTAALLVLSGLAVVFGFGYFRECSIVARLLIAAGGLVLIGLGIFFYMLLKKASLLHGICEWFLHILEKLHMVKRAEKRRKRLERLIQEYGECAETIFGHGHLLLEIFFWNLLQRISQIAVSFFVFMSMGYGLGKAWHVSVIQCFVALGSNCVPIPGGMGIADYLMLDGLQQVLSKSEVVTMELLCRGITFYGSVTVGLFVVIVGYIHRKLGEKHAGIL